MCGGSTGLCNLQGPYLRGTKISRYYIGCGKTTVHSHVVLGGASRQALAELQPQTMLKSATPPVMKQQLSQKVNEILFMIQSCMAYLYMYIYIYICFTITPRILVLLVALPSRI